jgi:hypothetical protein
MAFPNSLAASARFLARLTGVATESFESFAPGSSPTSLTFGATTATCSGYRFIREVTDPTTTIDGDFPTEGIRFLLLYPGDNPTAGSVYFTITFSAPQAAFGFFATDIEANSFQVVLVHGDGSRQTNAVPVTLPQGSGGVCYFGVIDEAQPFVAVEFRNIGTQPDGFGFDQLTIGTPEQVLPELQIWPAVELGWFAQTGRLYQIQWTPQLPTTQWFSLGSQVLGTGKTNFMFDSTRAFGRRFYRVVSTNQ